MSANEMKQVKPKKRYTMSPSAIEARRKGGIKYAGSVHRKDWVTGSVERGLRDWCKENGMTVNEAVLKFKQICAANGGAL